MLGKQENISLYAVINCNCFQDPYADEDEAVRVGQQEEKAKRSPSPERSASFYSKIMFEWFTKYEDD